jgi:hypothetical protein
VVLGERLEQRADGDVLVLAFVVEAERRRDDQRPAVEFQPRAAVAVASAAGPPLQGREPFRQVRSADVARLLSRRAAPTKVGEGR